MKKSLTVIFLLLSITNGAFGAEKAIKVITQSPLVKVIEKWSTRLAKREKEISKIIPLARTIAHGRSIGEGYGELVEAARRADNIRKEISLRNYPKASKEEHAKVNEISKKITYIPKLIVLKSDNFGAFTDCYNRIYYDDACFFYDHSLKTMQQSIFEFIILHETTHILNRDMPVKDTLRVLELLQKRSDVEKAIKYGLEYDDNSMASQYYALCEHRADVMGVLLSENPLFNAVYVSTGTQSWPYVHRQHSKEWRELIDDIANCGSKDKNLNEIIEELSNKTKVLLLDCIYPTSANRFNLLDRYELYL